MKKKEQLMWAHQNRETGEIVYLAKSRTDARGAHLFPEKERVVRVAVRVIERKR